jgi:hypothetical protein
MLFQMRAWCLVSLSLTGALFGASCSPGATPTPVTPIQVVSATVEPATVPTPTLVPTLPPTATPTMIPATPTTSATPVSSTQLKLDLDAIFPAGMGRDLVLNDCTVCHTFLRIVVGQRSKDQWEYVKRDMRGRVNQLSDQDVETLFDYLEVNFNETKRVPALPDWFLQTGEW